MLPPSESTNTNLIPRSLKCKDSDDFYVDCMTNTILIYVCKLSFILDTLPSK